MAIPTYMYYTNYYNMPYFVIVCKLYYVFYIMAHIKKLWGHFYNLFLIFQLSEPKVVKMKKLLRKAQSSYNTPFEAMIARVEEGLLYVYPRIRSAHYY